MIEILATAAPAIEQVAEAGMKHHTSPVLQTLGVAIVAGVALVLLSRRIGVSAIVLLLLGGVTLGPQVLNWVQPGTLGASLGPLINLAVGLILFEGGLTLNLHGYKSASTVIKRLLSIGVVTTWFGTGALIWFLFSDLFGGRPLAMSMLAASLVIVTGPTVIAPLLRRIRIRENLHDILHWEGVLIDPIGVFIAVLMFEYFTGGGAGEAVGGFVARVVAGLVVGTIMGFASDFMLRRRWIPDDSLNIFAISVAVLTFVFDDWLVPESGLLGVTVAGLILGWRRPGPLQEIKEFKAEITDLLVGTLFILLAAQLDFKDFAKFGWSGLLLVLGVVFLVRPISIMLCTLGTPMGIRERIFLSYVAPRGIVAASMASLFALSLRQYDSSWFLVTFTFSVIGFTVILQGSTAGLLARLLGLRLPEPDGWMIVGAHPFARRIAAFIRDQRKVQVVLVDANRRAVEESRSQGFDAIVADARDPETFKLDELRRVGNVLALTDNEELNQLICQLWTSQVGRENVHRWATSPPDPGTSGRREAGNVVWRNLPKPSLVSSELARHEVTLLVTETRSAEQQGAPIIHISKEQVKLDPMRADGDQATLGPGSIMLLQRSTDFLKRSLRPDLIVRLEEVTSQEDLFRELVERIVTVEPRLDRAQVVHELIERERSFPTALGHGIAVPHAYGRLLDRRLCAIAQVPQGIDFQAPDNQPVRLVFLLLSPLGDPEGHLATMGEIARLVSDQSVRQQLIEEADPGKLLPLISTARG
ncbi:hypothetical protein GC173_19000 [bacterium]|nr:hypothetical protein [bacterium]